MEAQELSYKTRVKPATLSLKALIVDYVDYLHPFLSEESAVDQSETNSQSNTGQKSLSEGEALFNLLNLGSKASKRPISWSILWRTLLADTSLTSTSSIIRIRASSEDEKYVEMGINTLISSWQRQTLDNNTGISWELSIGAAIISQLPYYGDVLEKFRSTDPEWVSRARRKEAAEAPRPTLDGYEIMAKFVRLLRANATSRKFCMIKVGRFGWVPNVRKVLDVVVLVAGHAVPIILRPKMGEKVYKVVGEAYIHGIMDGEAAEDPIAFKTIMLV